MVRIGRDWRRRGAIRSIEPRSGVTSASKARTLRWPSLAMRRPKAWRFRLTRTRLTVEGPGQRRTLDIQRRKATQYSRSAAAPAASEESDVAGPVHAALRMAPLP